MSLERTASRLCVGELRSIWVESEAVEPTVFMKDGSLDQTFVSSVGVSGKSAGPGDVAVAGGIEIIPGFAEDPTGALITFSQGEIIGSDVLFGRGELEKLTGRKLPP